MNRKVVLLMLMVLALISFNHAQGQNPEPQMLKGFVDNAIQKGYSASVRICLYDTVRKMKIPSYFSGVVVSKEGHILTVAHGVQVGKKYVAIFPDGTEVSTVTLGRIAFKESNTRVKHDLAMLKIDEPGEWPVGTHSADKFEGGKSVRLDGFKKVFAHDANIKSDECGGPVFDAEGNFYGINIARFSRTTTLVLPAPVIFDIITKDQLTITKDKL